MGLGADDPRNASVAIEALHRELAALIGAATAVVADHAASCQASFLRAEVKVQRRAQEQYGGLGNAWRYFANPDVMDLARALRKLQGEAPMQMQPAMRVLGPITPTERAP